MESLEVKEQFIELRAKGLSYESIARQLGKAKQTLIDWGKELSEEIRNRKALELEALYEKHYLQKEAKLVAYGQLLQRISAELEKRDFSDVPTAKLLELYSHYSDKVSEEMVEPVFLSSAEVRRRKGNRSFMEMLGSAEPEQPEQPLRLKAG
jgi:hypothetical protein